MDNIISAIVLSKQPHLYDYHLSLLGVIPAEDTASAARLFEVSEVQSLRVNYDDDMAKYVSTSSTAVSRVIAYLLRH